MGIHQEAAQVLQSNNDMEEEAPARALHLLTTDLLLAELISGRPIATDEGHHLTLVASAARGVLAWYRTARAKWSGNVMTPDCEAIITSIGTIPPALAVPSTASVHRGTCFGWARL